MCLRQADYTLHKVLSTLFRKITLLGGPVLAAAFELMQKLIALTKK